MKKRDYFYIEAWGRLMTQSKARIVSCIELARQEDAPESAIYKGQDGWVMLEHVTSPERRAILTNMVFTMQQRKR